MEAFYRRSIFTPFQLSDAAGIVFFGHIFSLSHEVYEQFIQEKLGITWDDWFKNKDWMIPIKQTHANYFAPLLAGLWYQVHLELKQMTNSSFTLVYRFYRENVEHCQVETLHVFCNRDTRKKEPIPEEIREKLESFCC